MPKSGFHRLCAICVIMSQELSHSDDPGCAPDKLVGMICGNDLWESTHHMLSLSVLWLWVQHAAELQRMASGIAETVDRRAAFISLFVDPSIDFYESPGA